MAVIPLIYVNSAWTKDTKVFKDAKGAVIQDAEWGVNVFSRYEAGQPGDSVSVAGKFDSYDYKFAKTGTLAFTNGSVSGILTVETTGAGDVILEKGTVAGAREGDIWCAIRILSGENPTLTVNGTTLTGAIRSRAASAELTLNGAKVNAYKGKDLLVSPDNDFIIDGFRSVTVAGKSTVGNAIQAENVKVENSTVGTVLLIGGADVSYFTNSTVNGGLSGAGKTIQFSGNSNTVNGDIRASVLEVSGKLSLNDIFSVSSLSLADNASINVKLTSARKNFNFMMIGYVKDLRADLEKGDILVNGKNSNVFFHAPDVGQEEGASRTTRFYYQKNVVTASDKSSLYVFGGDNMEFLELGGAQSYFTADDNSQFYQVGTVAFRSMDAALSAWDARKSKKIVIQSGSYLGELKLAGKNTDIVGGEYDTSILLTLAEDDAPKSLRQTVNLTTDFFGRIEG
ncbi:MAG: hypothetical protein PHS41_08780, partial [Victivallaceae bacterium]|nr:hypothetical protein [Victivallaceae bacterium]